MATSNLSAKCRPQGVPVATILIHFESQARRLSKEAMRHATKSTEPHRKISLKNQWSWNWTTGRLLKPPTTVVATTNTSTCFGHKPVRNMVLVPELREPMGGRTEYVPTRGPSSSDSMDVSTPVPPPDEVLRKAREIWRP